MLQELPPKSELENVGSSGTEEYASDSLDNYDVSRGNNISDEKDCVDLSQPGSSTQPQIPTWNLKKVIQKSFSDFTAKSGPNEKL
ncbi:hypothetical protein NPIL_349631 [Nephila pilipes]|uniref:Uncharacterized protein n=1 Tax=Nephila pilipes TaxID=299642 RepID=A0A8X6PNL1_NEPPI|nr:hypothetical protein NPIL_349631 [Nephila pilipes]